MSGNLGRKYPLESCVRVSDKKIVLSENKSKITFFNPQKKEYEKVHVDGEAITEGRRCDYLLTKYDSSPFGEYFVELKGSDVSHGITQLEETIRQLGIRTDEQIEKLAFVVASSVSPKIRTNIQNAKVQFKKNYDMRLLVRPSGYEYKLN